LLQFLSAIITYNGKENERFEDSWLKREILLVIAFVSIIKCEFIKFPNSHKLPYNSKVSKIPPSPF